MNKSQKQQPHQQYELSITALGGMGDGISEHDGKPVFVPFTCPQDVVKAIVKRETKNEIRADLLKIVTPSPLRQEPACQHFTKCGGCSLQHINTETYQAFKQRSLDSFVAGMGIDPSVIAPMVEIKTKSRRRAEFKVELVRNDIHIGFHAPRSHKLVEISECPISDDALLNILPPFKECLQTIKKPGRVKSISLTALKNGLDATLYLSSAIGMSDREKLANWAEGSNICRLNIQVKVRHESRRTTTLEDPICLYDAGNATINFAGVDVELPAAAFLQATEAGEHAITALVTEHLKGCNTIADLYSGCGTYSFSLIKQAQRVSAFEGADEMSAAMNNAAAASELDEHLSTTVRDLFTDPLMADELNSFDGLVINPPRNGALPQVEEIALSKVQKLVMVSCDPSTFKRDAKHLLDAGYTITLAVPIDQFYWSRHLELVAVFERKA